jgi:hypothetical protein
MSAADCALKEHVDAADAVLSALSRSGLEIIPRAQHDALMAAAFWLLKLRSLGYISAGHGRKIADETLAIVRAVGIEIKADTERDERLRVIGCRAAGIEIEEPKP